MGRIASLLVLIVLALLPLWGARAAATPAAPAGNTAVAAGTPQVTLPLSEFERLSGTSSVTVVESLRVSGAFAARELQLQISGRGAGHFPRVEFLRGSSGLSIFGCDGDAIISRSSG